MASMIGGAVLFPAVVALGAELAHFAALLRSTGVGIASVTAHGTGRSSGHIGDAEDAESGETGETLHCPLLQATQRGQSSTGRDNSSSVKIEPRE